MEISKPMHLETIQYKDLLMKLKLKIDGISEEIYSNTDDIEIDDVLWRGIILHPTIEQLEIKSDKINKLRIDLIEEELEELKDAIKKKDLKETVFKSKRLDSKNTHGTGCSLASSIATLLGRGFDIEAATSSSIEYVQNGIKKAPNFGQGNGPILHFDD